MSNPANAQELNDRLRLIESMIAEGRRKTSRWGWAFLLWGIAYSVATAWATLAQSAIAWPVTMVSAALLTVAIGRRLHAGTPSTTTGRSVGALWTAGGIALFVFGFCAAYSGHASSAMLLAGVEVILGLIHVASGLILCWWMQQTCGYVWMAVAAVSFFVPTEVAGYLFLGAVLVCNILFGLVLMMAEMRRGKSISASGSAHA